MFTGVHTPPPAAGTNAALRSVKMALRFGTILNVPFPTSLLAFPPKFSGVNRMDRPNAAALSEPRRKPVGDGHRRRDQTVGAVLVVVR